MRVRCPPTMTKIVGSTPKPVSATPAKAAAKKAAKPARAKAFGKVKTAAKQSFPRTTWQDTNKLSNELGKADKAGSKHPRIIHAESNATQGANHKPPIQMK